MAALFQCQNGRNVTLTFFIGAFSCYLNLRLTRGSVFTFLIQPPYQWLSESFRGCWSHVFHIQSQFCSKWSLLWPKKLSSIGEDNRAFFRNASLNQFYLFAFMDLVKKKFKEIIRCNPNCVIMFPISDPL